MLTRGLLKAYPAPLAIPLPSYQMGMDSSGGRGGLNPAAVAAPISILHHGDPRRQSTKSHHSIVTGVSQGPPRSHISHMGPGGGHHHVHHGSVHHHNHQFESSEDTSDTCLDDHGAGDVRSPFFLRSSNRRATGKRPKSGFWSRTKLGNSGSNKEDSSVAKDSGIVSREDGKHQCSCGANKRDSTEDNDSTCDSCSECAVESRFQAYSHFSRSPSRGHSHHASRSMRSGSSGHRRRHRSVSPRSKKLEDAIAAATSSHRSKSAGHLQKGKLMISVNRTHTYLTKVHFQVAACRRTLSAARSVPSIPRRQSRATAASIAAADPEEWEAGAGLIGTGIRGISQ